MWTIFEQMPEPRFRLRLECVNRRAMYVAPAIFCFWGLFCAYPVAEYSATEYPVVERPGAGIEALAIQHFYDLPGFDRVLASHNYGRFFEMESALSIQCNRILKQEVLGFDLELAFYQGGVWCELDGSVIPVSSAEFDLVTTDFVVECKSSALSREGEAVAQFVKEKNMLIWARWLWHKIRRGKLKIECQNMHRGRPVFILSGFSKKSKAKQVVACSWIDGQDSQECIDLFNKIIFMLSKKTLIVFFKNCADDDFTQDLLKNEIKFLGDVQYYERY